jgi:TetR/AcrR family transcriptional regulator, ethionamide resistance regulator
MPSLKQALAPRTDPDFRFAHAVAQAAAASRKSERTRARLQAATCLLLESVPPSELKVADICSRAQVAHGTFYVYFRDIRHLLAETLTAFVGFLQSAMRQAAKAEGTGRARRTTAAYVALFQENAGLMRCLVSRLDDFPEAMQAFQTLNREWTATVVDARLRRLAREGRTDPPGREELLRRAYALGGMVDQYLVMLLFGRDPALAAVSEDREAVIDTLSLIWERGMEP